MHGSGSRLDPLSDRLASLSSPTLPSPKTIPSRRPAIVADRQQPVLDGEPDAFFDQCPCDTWNAGAVGALLHEFFEIANRREGQGYWNAVSLGFFSGHAKTLVLNACTEK